MASPDQPDDPRGRLSEIVAIESAAWRRFGDDSGEHDTKKAAHFSARLVFRRQKVGSAD
jgi:hypothetical protein